ncbi:MAG: hypothetical protein HC933_10895, partial [Pleurocapsa sp. SU_196_0]|nr:hypothetical protein [Pleurocapsa sp. SU_196_0]
RDQGGGQRLQGAQALTGEAIHGSHSDRSAARHVSRFITKRGKGVGVRLGVKTTPAQLNDPAFPAIAFNISTQMDPWFTETAGNPQDGFLQTIEDIIRAEILKLEEQTEGLLHKIADSGVTVATLT